MHYYCGLTVFEGIIVGGENRPWLFAFFSILSFFQSLFVSMQHLKREHVDCYRNVSFAKTTK